MTLPTPAVHKGITDLRRQALATGKFQDPVKVTVSKDHHVALVDIPVQGTGTDKASDAALKALRGDVIPATIGKVGGVDANVTGPTAGSMDFNDLMKSHAPYVFLFVLTAAFLLLLVTFRSIVIPAKAIVLNLLSVGAAYGVLVAAFQWGWAEKLLGFRSVDGITSWLPLFMFVILFGLSMDYHVFILSRIREAYDRGMGTKEAVAHGVKTTASVVTSAAIVMVGVFGIFATLAILDFKMMGVGLATAILIDATIVRAVLLPATMTLLGDWNWYLPKWLEWLPRVTHEPAVKDVHEPIHARRTDRQGALKRSIPWAMATGAPATPRTRITTVCGRAPSRRDTPRFRAPRLTSSVWISFAALELPYETAEPSLFPGSITTVSTVVPVRQ